MKNIITETDSYKFGCHWNAYPKGTSGVYSYFECRNGAKWNKSLFFGLQYILKRHLEGVVVTREKIEKAAIRAKYHLGSEESFNRAGWTHILEAHGGKLPVRIKAVPEGSVIPVSNVLLTIENTDEKCHWLTGHLETILSRIWYPITVGTLSRETKDMIKLYLDKTADSSAGLEFMLHDFGYRSASSEESACLGAGAHLINFLGTDTMGGMDLLEDFYNASPEGLAFSVPASEHSIMTSLGKEGEAAVLEDLLNKYPTGILSVVADSYNIYNFVSKFVGERFKERILARPGIFVVRPDSVTPTHPLPEDEMLWIVSELYNKIGGTVNSKGYKLINPKVKVLWGDGINKNGIKAVLDILTENGYSTDNCATFGQGSALLTKVNRDDMCCAFKSSAQKRNGIWYDISKNPLDVSKKSKTGRLKLVKEAGTYVTVPESDSREDELKLVFENGLIIKDYNLAEIRERAKLG